MVLVMIFTFLLCMISALLGYEKNNIWSKIFRLMLHGTWISLLLIIIIYYFFSGTYIEDGIGSFLIFYFFGMFLAGILLLVRAVLLLIGHILEFTAAGIYKVAENSGKVVEVGKNATKNITNALNEKEYEVNIIEREQLKVETKVDTEKLTVERNFEYRRDRLVIIEEKTRNFFHKLFRKN